MEGRVDTQSPLVSSELRAGTLPSWAPYGVIAGSALFSALALLATGAFSIALLLVFATIVSCIAIYAWSRAVEGSRRAFDRLATFAIIAAFGLALIPLVSLLYQVTKRGLPGFDWEFLTGEPRGIIGGGGAYHAIVGTLVITAVASLISVPIGIMAAIYLIEYGRRQTAPGARPSSST